MLALTYYATILFVAGRPDHALEAARTGLARARATRDPYAVGMSLMSCARIHFLRRDPPSEAARYARECLALETAVVWHGATSLLERWSRCAEEPLTSDDADELVRRARSARYPMATTVQTLPVLAAILASGHRDKARALVDDLLAFATAHGERVVEPELLRVRGELDPDPAPYFHRAIAAARELGLLTLELRAATSLAALDASARPALTDTIARLTDGLSAPDVLAANALLS